MNTAIKNEAGNEKEATMQTKKNGEATIKWLTAPNRSGVPRLRTLSWGRLNRIYRARSATPAVRKAIEREARLCGYRPASILSLNAWA